MLECNTSFESFVAGSDINMLAELVSALPNAPPQSLLRASPLGLLLLVRHCVAVFRFAWLDWLDGTCAAQDPKNQASDFLNVVAINRESPGNHLQSGKTTPDVVNGALNSLRIIAQLVQ